MNICETEMSSANSFRILRCKLSKADDRKMFILSRFLLFSFSTDELGR